MFSGLVGWANARWSWVRPINTFCPTHFIFRSQRQQRSKIYNSEFSQQRSKIDISKFILDLYLWIQLNKDPRSVPLNSVNRDPRSISLDPPQERSYIYIPRFTPTDIHDQNKCPLPKKTDSVMHYPDPDQHWVQQMYCIWLSHGSTCELGGSHDSSESNLLCEVLMFRMWLRCISIQILSIKFLW